MNALVFSWNSLQICQPSDISLAIRESDAFARRIAVCCSSIHSFCSASIGAQRHLRPDVPDTDERYEELHSGVAHIELPLTPHFCFAFCRASTQEVFQECCTRIDRFQWVESDQSHPFAGRIAEFQKDVAIGHAADNAAQHGRIFELCPEPGGGFNRHNMGASGARHRSIISTARPNSA